MSLRRLIGRIRPTPTGTARARVRPRVLLVHRGGAKGSDDGILTLVRRLRSRYDTAVLLMEDGPLATDVEDLGVRCHSAGLPGRRSVPRHPLAARGIADEVRAEGEIAVIHAYGTRPAMLGAYLSRHLDAPMVWSPGNGRGRRLTARLIGPSCERIILSSADAVSAVPGWLRERISTAPDSPAQLSAEIDRHYSELAGRAQLAPPPVDGAAEFASSRRIARNTLVRSAGEIAAKVASVAFYVVMARKLGTEGFGNFIFGLSLSSVVLVTAGLGMDMLLAREISRDRDAVHRLLTDVIVLKSAMLFALTGVLAGIVLTGPYSAETSVAVILIAIGVGVEMQSQTLHAVVQGFERMDLGAAGLALQRGITALVGIGVLLFGGGLIAACLVFVAGSVAGVIVSDRLMRKVVRPAFRIDRSQWASVLKVSAPIGAASLMFTILLRIDATLISFLTDGDQGEVGNYGAAYRLVDATMFMPAAFSAAMLPWLSRQGERSAALLRRGTVVGLKVLVAILLPIGVGYAVFAPHLIDLLYGPQFEDAIQPLRFLGLMTVLYGICWYASSLLIARHEPGLIARGLAVVIVLNVALNLALIPSYGAAGAAFAALVSGLALAVYSLRKVWKVVGRFSLTRAIGGPLLASGALAAAGLLLGLPFAVAAAIAALAYLAVLLAFEVTIFFDDYELVTGVIRQGSKEPAAPS